MDNKNKENNDEIKNINKNNLIKEKLNKIIKKYPNAIAATLIILFCGTIAIAFTLQQENKNNYHSEVNKVEFSKLDNITKTINYKESEPKFLYTGTVINKVDDNTTTPKGIGQLSIQLDNGHIIDYNVMSDETLRTDNTSKYNNVQINKKLFSDLNIGDNISIMEPQYKAVGKVKEFNKIPYKDKNNYFKFKMLDNNNAKKLSNGYNFDTIMNLDQIDITKANMNVIKPSIIRAYVLSQGNVNNLNDTKDNIYLAKEFTGSSEVTNAMTGNSKDINFDFYSKNVPTHKQIFDNVMNNKEANNL